MPSQSVLAALLSSIPLLLAVLVALWVLSVAIRNVSIVDIFWGPGFAVLAWYQAAQAGLEGARATAVLAAVTLWALRLGLHLGVRNVGKGEDPRYAAFRAAAGPPYWWKSFFSVFLLQGALMFFISLPVQLVWLLPPVPPGPLMWVGLLVFGVGLVFEAVGDAQLTRFKADAQNRGRVMDQGLWRYTRHPNYFGDACAWWGLWLMTVEVPGLAFTLLSPLVMNLLLLKVSGVPLLEKTLVKTRPAYAEYVRRTPAFVPWFPRD